MHVSPLSIIFSFENDLKIAMEFRRKIKFYLFFLFHTARELSSLYHNVPSVLHGVFLRKVVNVPHFLQIRGKPNNE